MQDYTRARQRMIEKQLRSRGILPPILQAFAEVPREHFIDARFAELAYRDHPLPIAAGQTISQPYIVALTAQSLLLQAEDKVLEIGAGSGYAAAILSRLAARVVAVERVAELAEGARARLRSLGFDNVRIVTGDGSRGFPEEAPYDAIAVAAGAPKIPDELKKQLKVGGRLVIPVGEEGEQSLLVVTRTDQETFQQRDLGGVRFVPLLGERGWRSRFRASRAARPQP
jgi:protein-L-isoaspartate(D-aspartate) O-methyltransferase